MAHYLRCNEGSRTPPVILVLGTRSADPMSGAPDAGRLFCWDLRGLVRNVNSYKDPVSSHAAGRTQMELAQAVDRACAGQQNVWLYAHDLARSITVSGLLNLLPSLGWEVIRMAPNGLSPSFTLGKAPYPVTRHRDTRPARLHHEAGGVTARDCLKARDVSCPGWSEETRYRCHLVICEAGSVWPRTTVAAIASALNRPRPPDPSPDDLGGQADRAAADTGSVMDALITLLDWWDAHDGGNWARTGAGTGWNSMRHRMPARTVVIETDHPSVPMEHDAVYGGRRELARWMPRTRGRFTELDFYRAYTKIAAEEPLPVRRLRCLPSLPADDPILTRRDPRYGLIAEVTISRGEGRFPCRDGDRVWYPDGRFTTVLAGPDIREAAALGVLESVGTCQIYQLGTAIAPWARWNLAMQEDPGTPEVVRMALKHHGRAAIGKWAGTSYTQRDLGPALYPGFAAEPHTDHHLGKHGWEIHLGGRRTFVYPDGEAEGSFPAVLAYVESHVRVRLSRMIAALGTTVIVQADTDGAHIDAQQLATADLPGLPDVASPGSPVRVPQIIAGLNSLVAPLTVREKEHAREMSAVGPQHYTFGTRKIRSGIPGDAAPGKDGISRGTTRPTLLGHAHRGAPGAYREESWAGIEPVCLASGWVLASGRTVPPEACIGADGKTCLLPWELTVWHWAGLELGQVQNPMLLAAVRDPGPYARRKKWTAADLAAIREEYG